MVREGTRSQTGNSRPRIFPVVDSGPATVRKRAPKTKKDAKAANPKPSSKPTGVTKTKAKMTKGPKQTKTVTGGKGVSKNPTKKKATSTSTES